MTIRLVGWYFRNPFAWALIAEVVSGALPDSRVTCGCIKCWAWLMVMAVTFSIGCNVGSKCVANGEFSVMTRRFAPVGP